MRIIGIDPGLNHTGWGCIEVNGNRLIYIACGRISPPSKAPFGERLSVLYDGLCDVFDAYKPDMASIEETFMNNNAASAIKLGMARGVACLAPAKKGVTMAEYSANKIKKTVVGAGHAGKGQIQAMVKVLLPLAEITSDDAGDALAIAICHAHHAGPKASIVREAV